METTPVPTFVTAKKVLKLGAEACLRPCQRSMWEPLPTVFSGELSECI